MGVLKSPLLQEPTKVNTLLSRFVSFFLFLWSYSHFLHICKHEDIVYIHQQSKNVKFGNVFFSIGIHGGQHSSKNESQHPGSCFAPTCLVRKNNVKGKHKNFARSIDCSEKHDQRKGTLPS